MFASIARRYDTANEILSLGIHKAWRRAAVGISGAGRGQAVLDCARDGRSRARVQAAVGAGGEVIGTDFCAEMLESAPAKGGAAGPDVKFAVADALALPYPDASFERGFHRVRHPETWTTRCAACARWPGWSARGSGIVLESASREDRSVRFPRV